MGDRGIPRSYRMMEGFGIHTFRLENADGPTSLAKFHWKPVLGVHSLTWEEAQLLGGADPDFHRRDLADAIESGDRKSTRLNSSHVAISYAVLCLKKNNKGIYDNDIAYQRQF